MEVLVLWLVMAVAIMVAAFVLPGVQVGFFSALIAALVLGLVNALLRPVLLFLISPLTLVTTSVFIFFVNAALLSLVSALVPGFSIRGIGWAIAFGIVLTVIHVVICNLVFSLK